MRENEKPQSLNGRDSALPASHGLCRRNGLLGGVSVPFMFLGRSFEFKTLYNNIGKKRKEKEDQEHPGDTLQGANNRLVYLNYPPI
jgi:hypothetical protein